MYSGAVSAAVFFCTSAERSPSFVFSTCTPAIAFSFLQSGVTVVVVLLAFNTDLGILQLQLQHFIVYLGNELSLGNTVTFLDSQADDLS